jgi:hypothetical protein
MIVWPYAVVAAPKPPPPPTPAPIPRREDGRRRCEWLENSKPPYTRCQEACWRNSSWCEEHYRKVFIRRSDPPATRSSTEAAA